MLGVVVFLAAFALDFLYAHWIVASTQKKPVKAGLYSSAIGGLSCLGIVSVVDSPAFVVPYVAGLFAGTAAGVWSLGKTKPPKG